MTGWCLAGGSMAQLRFFFCLFVCFFKLVGSLNFFVCLIIWLLFVFFNFVLFFFCFILCFVLFCFFPQLKMKLITVTWCFTTELHLQVNISSKCWVQSHLYVF